MPSDAGPGPFGLAFGAFTVDEGVKVSLVSKYWRAC